MTALKILLGFTTMTAGGFLLVTTGTPDLLIADAGFLHYVQVAAGFAVMILGYATVHTTGRESN
ncbi:hypothetical protein LCGC14_1336870 [marine sediment metagenome]|uniref:Uncharacterized protein n=1 Tax=marine sediment metagenome TaxID=412755 RepID=A0A0F9KEQ0_9ZZZZ